MAAKKKAAAKKAAPKKAAPKKAAPKKAAAKKAPAKKAAKRKPNPAFMAPMTPSAELAAVIGPKPRPRSQVAKDLWAYIHKNGLQDSKVKRNINPDDALGKVFGAKKTIDMFKMTALVNKHLKK